MKNTVEIIGYLRMYYWGVIISYLLIAIVSSALLISFREYILLVIILGLLTVFEGIHGVGIYFTESKSRSAYIYHLMLIAFGLTGLLTLLPSIYFLVHFLKPEIKEYFSMTS